MSGDIGLRDDSIIFYSKEMTQTKLVLLAHKGIKLDWKEEAAIAKVRLTGACESCAMSAQTLRMGIERHLTQTFPEIVGVMQVL